MHRESSERDFISVRLKDKDRAGMVGVGLDNGLKDRLPDYDLLNDGMFKMAVSNILRQMIKKGLPVVIDGDIVGGITS